DVRVSLTIDDDTALANNARYVTDVVPELSRNLQVQKGTQNINVNVVGTTPNYVPVKNYTITAGRMFTAGDDAARRRFAVLGSAVPNMLNANAAAMIGQELLIRGIPFEIIGILSEKGSQGSFSNPDEQILIPLQTARYRIMGTDRLRSITVKVQDMSSMNLAMIDLERVLRRQHKIRPGQDNDFQIRNQTDILATLQQTTETFKYLLAGIAAVSLLVGGIGIMNIMLVSVTERTREIGVRKALGATRFNVMFQFLVEALVLCLVGGMIGVVVGTIGAVVLSKLAHWNTLISPFAILLALHRRLRRRVRGGELRDASAGTRRGLQSLVRPPQRGARHGAHHGRGLRRRGDGPPPLRRLPHRAAPGRVLPRPRGSVAGARPEPRRLRPAHRAAPGGWPVELDAL